MILGPNHYHITYCRLCILSSWHGTALGLPIQDAIQAVAEV